MTAVTNHKKGRLEHLKFNIPLNLCLIYLIE